MINNNTKFPCIAVDNHGLYLLCMSCGSDFNMHGIVLNDKHSIYHKGDESWTWNSTSFNVDIDNQKLIRSISLLLK
jgi:hypothetical protein